MAKYLVIVESPAKVKTIKKFLGSNYEVMASQGHIRDLPKSQLGVDVDNDYEPKYITIRGKGDILAALRKEAKKADKVYLATDPDREGEAISWHLAKALKLEDKDIYRITFNEITKNAVKASIKNARKIDMNLVDAQQSRRVLDRMVGYRISPLLWAKIKRGLSAGRVQSVALRIICDREDEINSFIPDEYWTIDADVNIKGEKNTVKAKFYGDENGKIDVKNGEQAEKIIEEVKKSDFSVESVKHGEKIKKVPLAFTTSTLQQEAAKQLNFATQKTMRLAQQLYEGVDIAGRGTIGIITYLRTDSTRIADEAVAAAAQYIGEQYGEEYVGTVHDTKEKKKISEFLSKIRGTVIDDECADAFMDAFTGVSVMNMEDSQIEKSLWEKVPREKIELTFEQIKNIAGFFARIVDYKSPFTSTHSIGVAECARKLSGYMGFDDETVQKMYLAGALHDIGKVAIGNDILEKPDRLTDEEFDTMKHHALYTYRILSDIDDFDEIRDWAAFHHERLDGTGYPFGKSADELNECERIMACVDIYQALTESRPYKKGMTHEKAIGILEDMAQKGWLDKNIVLKTDECFSV